MLCFVIHTNDSDPLKRKLNVSPYKSKDCGQAMLAGACMGLQMHLNAGLQQTPRYSNFILKKPNNPPKVFQICSVGPDFSPTVCDLDGTGDQDEFTKHLFTRVT